MRRVVTVLLTLALACALAAGPSTAAPSPAAGTEPAASAAAKKKKSKKKKTSRCTVAKARAKKAKSKKAKARARAHVRKACRKPKKKVVKPGVPGTPVPPVKPELEPFDYQRNANLSQPTYGEKDIERIVHQLPGHDGAKIYLEVVKPKGATNLGVILEASGYHGTLYDRTGTRILPLPLGKSKVPVGLTGYFPQRGYAVVMMDLRGTGKSEGCLDHLGPNDQRDLKAVIEWAATQSWSNGRVGMVGHSYVGSTPQAATKLNPKGLVTIVPSAGLPSIYDHQFQHGVAWNLQYAGPLVGYPPLAMAADLPPGASEPISGAPTGDGWGSGRPQDTGCGWTNTQLNSGAGGTVLGQRTAWHAERDAVKEAVAWPGHVFLIHGVNDEAARIASMYWFTQRGGRKGDKLWLGPWDHGIGCCPNQRGMQWTAALQAWFDRHLLLKEVDTGPPVEIYLNDQPTHALAIAKRQEIHTQRAWPGTPKLVRFGSGGTGELVQGGAGAAGNVTFDGDPRGYAGVGGETASAELESKPLAEDLLVVGVPQLDLRTVVVGPRTDIIVNVIDRDADGRDRRFSVCAMTPLLRDGLDTLSPIVPNEQMDLKPPCWATGHKLRKGHKLVLRFSTSDDEYVPFGGLGRVTVFTGADATAMTLPVADGSPPLYRDTFPVGPAPSGAGVGA